MTCPCQKTPQGDKSGREVMDHITWLVFGLLFWGLLYFNLSNIAKWFTYRVLHLTVGTHLAGAVEFFTTDAPKVFLLLTLVVYGVGFLRSYITPARTKRFLAGKHEFLGNILAALIGTVTPFCSCSAVPLFIGFVTAGVPLGVTFSYLISAPMVNEIALILLYGLLGWKVAAIYLVTGLAIAIISGIIIGRLHLEKHVEKWVYEAKVKEQELQKFTWAKRFDFAWASVKDILRKVWAYMLIGIAIGALIHGYVPQSFMANLLGKSAWWAVPIAVIIGVPMYSNAAGVVPIVEALLGKGAALGSVLAFMMSVIALSFPEMVILRRILKPKLIAVFIGVVTAGILLVGYLFNLLM